MILSIMSCCWCALMFLDTHSTTPSIEIFIRFRSFIFYFKLSNGGFQIIDQLKEYVTVWISIQV